MPILTLPANIWLIAYDIANPRRLQRIYRAVKGDAMPVQYSVFLGVLNDKNVRRLAHELGSEINPAEDDVRFYHLPASLQYDCLGRPWIAEGLFLGQREKSGNESGK